MLQKRRRSRRRKKIIGRQWDYRELLFRGLEIINQFASWTFLPSKASPEFNMQHGMMLVPESQTQTFNLVIMCKLSSALPIFHSHGRVSSWAALGCKWVSKWNKGIKEGNRLFRQEKQCQGGETDAFSTQGREITHHLLSPINKHQKTSNEEKSPLKRQIFLALIYYGLSQSLYMWSLLAS